MKKDELIKIMTVIPDAILDLKYATENNFTGRKIYDFEDALLRAGTLEKLKGAADRLRKMGYRIKVLDAFRPEEAQKTLWSVVSDPTFVADPYNGGSNHTRGNAIDMTLTDMEGNELDMPSGFDDFSVKALRTYEACSEEQKINSLIMENVMKECGFIPYPNEWWHFDDSESYELYKESIGKALNRVMKEIR
ncbi:MAG: M15 family metallopeptidase [Clostridia bacterium]|nr:M15 family metallopeptidase [Clostridia bacterium]MBQ5956502.1 M15 family metallopeptidase [Clostridia bacterium]